MISLILAAAAASDYHGYTRTDIEVSGLKAVVVAPNQAHPERRWIWRIQFFDHRPEVDLALLERGYHLAFVELGNSLGSPVALHQMSLFYAEAANRFSLNSKVVLEGFSRGGLFAYRWAVQNPDKVQAIYGDAPVCDFKTWPFGGRGSKRSDSDWQGVISQYGFPNEEAALSYPFNPVDTLGVLAKAQIPIIHVVGEADSVVAVQSNTNVVERRYRELGGTIKVIRKPGVDHHPHSLDNTNPVVDFLAIHEGDTAMTPPASTIPAPSLESRYNSAGWRGRSWLSQHDDAVKFAQAQGSGVLLLGDSITQSWGGPGRRVGQANPSAWEKYLKPFHPVNMGISGDRTQNVLWRIENGALDGWKPNAVVLLIGVNNTPSDSAQDIALGIETVAEAIRRKIPDTPLIITALFPVGEKPDDPRRAKVLEINNASKNLCDIKGYRWLDLTSHFLNDDGTARPDRMAGDFLHLSAGGYEVWGREMSRTLKNAIEILNTS